MKQRHVPRDRITTLMLVTAALWAAGLLVAAATLPAYRSTSVSATAPATAATAGTAATAATANTDTLPPPVIRTTSGTMVQVNGAKVFAPLAIPLVAVGAVAVALRRRRVAIAWAITALLGAFTFLAMLTVGIFVLPVAVLLALACSRTVTPALAT